MGTVLFTLLKGRGMEKADFVPRRTPNGEYLVVDDVRWLTEWERLARQVFILSDGSRNVGRIALLLHRPVDTILNICQALTASGSIALEDKKRTLVMDVPSLKESFESIPDQTLFAHQFYGILFNTFPDARPLFAHTDWKKQYSSLMATIAAVVRGVERGDNMIPTFHQLGEQHRRHGAKPEHYPIVGACLITTFKRALGDNFTQKMQDAWTIAFEVISTEMIKGAAQ